MLLRLLLMLVLNDRRATVMVMMMVVMMLLHLRLAHVVAVHVSTSVIYHCGIVWVRVRQAIRHEIAHGSRSTRFSLT